MKYMIKSLTFVVFFVSISIQVLASCPGLGAFSINTISASNITESTIYLTWTSSANADSYKVFYRIGTGDWVQSPGTILAGSTREHTISGLSGGVTYGIIVTAFDFCEDGEGGGGGGGGGEIPFAPLSLFRDRSTSVRTVLTEPAKPSTRSADDQAVSSFLARWQSTNTATSYRLDVSTSSSFSSFVTGYNNKNVGSVTESSVTGLQSATKYYYRIRAVNGSGTSISSNGRNAYTIPNTPSLNNASNQEQNSFEASWGTVTRADSYRLDVSTSSSFGSYVSGYNNRSVLGTSQTVTGLNPGTTYYFRVRAYDTSGTTTSSSSSSKSTITIPDEPNTSAPSHLNQTSFRAIWVAETGASSYRLDVSEVSDFSSVVDGYDNKFSSGTSETVIGLDGGKTYYYRVQAVNSSGFSDPSPSPRTALLKPADPSAELASNPEPHQFTAHWQDNAISPDSYLIEIADNDEFIDPLAGYDDPITGTSIDINGLDGGTIYYYRLKAINNSGESNYSNAIEIITVPSQPQTTTPSDFSETSFSANWEAEGGSSAYYLDVSESDDFSSFLPGYNNLFVNGTTQEISDLARGSSYYYRVRAANSSGISISSEGEPALTISQAPTPQSATDLTQAEFVTHWEAVSGADSYLLDVSISDNFSSFVSGYQNLPVASTSQLVEGLASGITYYYRVKSQNASGISSASTTVEALTVPANPDATVATTLTETSVKATWQAVTGASVYRLDVSATSDFDELLTGYDNLSVSTTSKTITGLEGGSTYYYRVRAENATGTSDHSNTIETLTVPAAPVASSPSTHSTSTFTAHWEQVKGTDTYLLDVSASANFSDFVEGYEARPITGSSTQVSGLTAGTTYHYRVRAENASGTSDPSEVIATLTITEQTSILDFADHTSTKFRVSWEEVSGVGSYQVLVATDPNFNNTVAGNDPLIVQNFLTEAFVEGLTPNTIYYVKVRSINGSGNSDYSVIKTTATANSDGSVVKPSINNLDFDDQAMSLTWSVSGGTGGITSILVSHRKITESEFTTTQISVEQSGDYQISVDTDWMDAIGMQYQVEAQDLAGRNDLTDLVTYNKTVEDIEVSITETFGTTVNDYQIISIPYELSTTRIEDLFEGVLGNYDKAKWRLLKYKNDESGYVDYEDGLAVSNVERGAGYWFISSQSVNLMFGDGLTPSNTIDEPFELELNQGWNQIGNPYLENINWSDILEANDNPEAVGSLLVYNSAEASFQEGDVLHVFGGGFVFADQATSLTIPVDINVSASGGRVRSAAQSASVKDWQLDFRLSQGQKINPLSGIGMSARAQQGKDQADMLNPPHFGDQVSIYTQHDEFFYTSFTKDIIDLQPQYHWEFNLQSDSDEAVVLSWDPGQLPDGTLILYDLHANRIVDMTSSSDYTFTKANQTFNIYYSSQLIELENKDLLLGRAFPNPVIDRMEIPYGFHIGAERSKVEVRIFDRQGIEVLQHSTTSQAQGIRSLVWDRKDTEGQQLPAGLYFYQISSITGSHSQQSTGKIIIK